MVDIKQIQSNTESNGNTNKKSNQNSPTGTELFEALYSEMTAPKFIVNSVPSSNSQNLAIQKDGVAKGLNTLNLRVKLAEKSDNLTPKSSVEGNNLDSLIKTANKAGLNVEKLTISSESTQEVGNKNISRNLNSIDELNIKNTQSSKNKSRASKSNSGIQAQDLTNNTINKKIENQNIPQAITQNVTKSVTRGENIPRVDSQNVIQNITKTQDISKVASQNVMRDLQNIVASSNIQNSNSGEFNSNVEPSSKSSLAKTVKNIVDDNGETTKVTTKSKKGSTKALNLDVKEIVSDNKPINSNLLTLSSILKTPKELLKEQIKEMQNLEAQISPIKAQTESNINSNQTIQSLLSKKDALTSSTQESKTTKDITQIESSSSILGANSDVNFEFRNKVANVKETFKSFASDLKEKMEDYKPPIMKMELTLNPKDLGALDVTLVTRGNSIQINLASNQQAIQLFSQNMNEFKEALANIGFENFTMNFNSNQSGNSEQQNQEGKKIYEYMSKLSKKDFSLEDEVSLDIFVPNYA